MKKLTWIKKHKSKVRKGKTRTIELFKVDEKSYKEPHKFIVAKSLVCIQIKICEDVSVSIFSFRSVFINIYIWLGMILHILECNPTKPFGFGVKCFFIIIIINSGHLKI